MNVDAMTSPSAPTATIVTGIASAKSAGWTRSSGMPKATQPQTSVAASEYRPIVDVASAIGKKTSTRGGGAATTGSSTPCQRMKVIRPPDPKSVDVQIPIRPAESDA